MLRPIKGRVIIELSKAPDKTVSGLFLPETLVTETNEAIIVAVGADVTAKPGEQILLAKFAGTSFRHDSKEYVTIRESEILAFVE